MKVIIKDTEGNTIELDFPTSLKAISLNQLVAFNVTREEISLWLKNSLEDESLYENNTYYLYIISKAVSAFFDINLHEILKLDASKLIDDEGNLLPLVLREHFESLSSGDFIDMKSAETTILTLYSNLSKLVDSYKFEFKSLKNYQFRYKGVLWEIPYVSKELFTGKKIFSKVSVQQAVEALQVKKLISKSTYTGDDLMNFRFSSYLRIISIVTKKPDEEIPLDDVGFEERVNNNMVYFQDLDAKTALDAAFFLMGIILS